MQWLQKFHNRYNTKDAAISEISQLKLSFTDDCKPTWNVMGEDVNCLVNVYPKEWMINEIDHDGMIKYDFKELRSYEPLWKLVMANKGLLPLLWSMYPNHPNLLPAYFDSPDYDKNKNWVSKPLFGREGLGVMLSPNYTKQHGHEEGYRQFVATTESNFGRDNVTNEKLGKSIYQEYMDMPVA